MAFTSYVYDYNVFLYRAVALISYVYDYNLFFYRAVAFTSHVYDFNLFFYRAVALGLTADDMMEVDRFIGDLKEKRAIEDTKERLRSDADRDHLKIKVRTFLIKYHFDKSYLFCGKSYEKGIATLQVSSYEWLQCGEVFISRKVSCHHKV